MTAQILDGTATLRTIKAELAERWPRSGARRHAGLAMWRRRRPGSLVRRRQAQGLRLHRDRVDPA